MKKVFKLSLSILLLLTIAILGFACSGAKVDYTLATTIDDVDYSKVQSIEINNESIVEGFLLSEFDITKVKLNVTYLPTIDDDGKEVPGVTLPPVKAKESMIKAEDKAKLRMPGSNNITLIYGKFTIEFVLKLYDDAVQKVKVIFLSDDGSMIGDAQYIAVGGKPVVPNLATKSGFVFIGWKDGEAFSTLENIQKDTTLRATYAPSTYEVTFYQKIGVTEVQIGGAVNVPRHGNAYDHAPEIPILPGYSNGRWENIDAMKEVDSAGLKFYAIYDRDQIQITYVYKRTSEADTKYEVTTYVNEEIKNPPVAERSGYKFVGWYANDKKITFPYKVTNEMTFVAKYIDLNAGNKGLSYTATDGGYSVTGYDGAEEFVVIPITTKVGGITGNVVSVKDGVFKDFDIKEFVVSENNKNFKTVDSVLYNFAKTKIIAYPRAKLGSFYTLDTACELVGKYAFYNAQSLEVITLSDKVTSIGEYAFAECNNLTSFSIKKSVRQIGEGAFKISDGISALSEISIEPLSELASIGDEAFYGLDSLTSVTLPLSLTTLGDRVFYNCKSLALITVPTASERKFNVLSGALYSKDYKTLYALPALYGSATNSEFVVDSRAEVIKSGAFSWTKISSILIGSATEPILQIDIQDQAIVCPNLLSIRIFANDILYTLRSFGDYVPNIFVEDSNAKLGSLRADFDTKVKEYSVDSWTNSEDYSNDFIYIKERVITNVGGSQVETTGITILGIRRKVENLNIPNLIGNHNVTKIAPYAFSGDNTIQSVILPVDLIEIGYRAFYNAINLQKVTIGDLVTTINDEAFFGCRSLDEFEFSEELEITSFGLNVTTGTAWQDSAQEMLALGNVLVKFNGLGVSAVIPSTISYIATDCFEYRSNLTSVTFLGESLKVIDTRAFQYCSGLASISLPKSIALIKNQAFFGCTYLYLVTYLDVITNNDTLVVEDGAFDSLNPVYQIFRDTSLFSLTYYIDSADTVGVRGIAFVNPHHVENTGTSRFAGWYEDDKYTSIAKFPLSIATDTTLYAKWIPIKSSTTGLEFDLNGSGQYYVKSYSGTDSYIIVPAEYKGKKVTEIGSGVFRNMSFITRIELPNTLETSTGAYKSEIQVIGENAFDGTFWFDNYQGDFVIIDDILIKYKGTAKEVRLPANISKIAKGAFKGNEFIEKVILSDIVTLLADGVFENCINLHTVVLPKALLQISNKVFSNCVKLANIDFSRSESLSSIGHDALENTKWLSSYIDDCVVINKILYKYQGKATKLHIINHIENISERAFYGNTTIKTIYIPESVKYIGQSTFEGCIALTDVRLFGGDNVLESISDRAFFGCISLTLFNFSLADNLTYIGKEAFSGCTNYFNLFVPASLDTLGEYSFYNTGLKTITFSEGSKLTTISNYAFASNSVLTSVIFIGQNSLKVIGKYAFANNEKLTTFNNMGSKIETISEGAFSDCEALTSLDIDISMLSEIGNNALEGVVGVLNKDENMVELGNILISYNGMDKNVTIPKYITTIYNNAFSGNELVEEISFEEGSSLKGINSKAFYGCTNLVKINFPSSIVYVGDDVMTGTKWYNDRRNDEFIYISGTLIKYNAISTKQVIIPEYISVINANVFDNTSVHDITIGQNVIRIASGAFDNIKTDTYPNWTITMLGENPPELLEVDEIGVYKILLNSLDTIDSFRVDAGWGVQYNAGKLFAKPTYEVTFVIETGRGEPISPKKLYAIYSEIDVNTYVDENIAYIFTGWYRDSEYSIPLVYPYMLSGAITLYAKCVDNSVGSNPAYYTVEDYTTIVRYHHITDNKVVIIAERASEFITATGQSYQPDDNGIYVFEGGEYVINPVSTAQRYSYLGAFENHTELVEVYFAQGSKLHTIGTNAFANCTNLRKIVIPSTIKTIKSGAFINCTSLQEIVFMDGATDIVIESGAFENCTALTTLHLPNGLKILGDGAFLGCNSLKDIYIYVDTPIMLGNEVQPFELLEGLVIHIPNGRYNFYANSWVDYEQYLEEMD